MNRSDALNLFPKDTGFGQLIDQAVCVRPDHLAIITDDARLTYRELDTLAARLAAALARDGIGTGDPVAIISRNCAEYLIIELALYRLGAVSVKMNWRTSAEELEYMLEFNQVQMVFLRYENKECAAEICPWMKERKIPCVLLNQEETGPDSFPRYVKHAPPPETFHPRPIPLDAPLLRLHTSGTTGKPKCVVHSHRDFIMQIRSCLDVLWFASDTVHMMVSQMFHVACIGAYMVLAVGGTIVLQSSFDVEKYLGCIQRERVTSIGVLPVVLKRMFDHPNFASYDLSSLKQLNYSTSPMPTPLLIESIQKLGAGCAFYQSYGMTEMSSVVTVLSPEDHRDYKDPHLRSVGRPIPGVEIRIQREDGTEAERGEIGEILLKGPGQMREYYHGPTAVPVAAPRDGWYHSMDMGWMDEAGYLFFAGRKDDMIISGGENIYPKEILDTIMALTEDVAEADVYGVPDPVWGEHVKARVVLVPGSTLSEEDLMSYCRSHIAHYKAPKEIEIVKELPKNTTGKICRRLPEQPTTDQAGNGMQSR